MKKRTHFKFRLYVADDAMNSAQARSNLAAICTEHCPGQFSTEVIDVFRHPKRALEEGIFMTPTLVKVAPLPVQTIVGTLSDTDSVIVVLGLQSVAP